MLARAPPDVLACWTPRNAHPPSAFLPTLVQGIIAGGDSRTCAVSAEKAEDDPQPGRGGSARASTSLRLDALVGIAASGRTPYVLERYVYARELGALTIGSVVLRIRQSPRLADIAITPVPGPEVITGSTRMRAGTATKLVLNMLSTGVMIRRGLVYGNLMVNVQPTNEKLIDRACRIIADIAGVPYDRGCPLAGTMAVRCERPLSWRKPDLPAPRPRPGSKPCGGRLRQALGEIAVNLFNDMDKFKIVGGTPLSGELPVSGSKNSALPALAACLLTGEPVTLHRVPQVKDLKPCRSWWSIRALRFGRTTAPSACRQRRWTGPKPPTKW